MRFSGSRFRLGLSALIVGAATVALAVGNGDHTVAGAASSPAPASGVTAAPFQIVLQTMNSCAAAIDGAVYQLLNASGGIVATAGHTITLNHPGTIGGGGGGCPIQQGDCVSTNKGCLVFPAVSPGDYRLRPDVSQRPAASTTNPSGYAPCNSGSACQWQDADVTVNNDGTILARVTNVAPNGQVQTFPSDPAHSAYFAATPSDPIVFHDFGLCAQGACPLPGNPTAVPPVPPTPNTCDGDGDEDDWNTGAHSGQCSPSETAEAALLCPAPAGQPGFPWLCHSNPVATPAHLQDVTLSGPSSVNALSDVTVNVSNGVVGSLVSAQDPGMSAVPNGAGGFTVALDPVRGNTGSKKNPTTGITSGQVTIGVPGGRSSLVVTVNPPSANSNFVENLYHDVLGRYGLPNEIGFWEQQLINGEPTGAVAAFFANSHEVHGRMVDHDFQSMVGVSLSPNDPGRLYWQNQLDAGALNETIIGQLGAAQAFYDQAGSDSAFVTALYSKVLGRTPSPSEVSYWTGFGPFANNANARLYVANGFAFSHEQHKNIVVAPWYTTYLHRSASGDPTGWEFWAEYLDQGHRDEIGVAAFTSLTEY